MNTDAGFVDQPTSRPRRERLTTTLIFALLFHGIILLGVGFVALVPDSPPATTVKVTVATSGAAHAPQKAYYLARFNQLGAGNTRVRAPEHAPAAGGQSLVDHGAWLGNHLARLLAKPVLHDTFSRFDESRPERADRLVTTKADSRLVAKHVYRPADTRPRNVSVRLSAPAPRQARALSPSAVKLPRLYGPHPEANARTTKARQAIYAPYLLAWRQRIEQVGTHQFAKLVPHGIKKGHLTLSVTLGRDGSVRSLSIIKRSAHPELDAAALKIIRLAAPFAPFPPKIRALSQTLTFTYRWNFYRHAGRGALGLGG